MLKDPLSQGADLRRGLGEPCGCGEIIDGYKDITTISRYNGQPTIMLSIQREAGSNC